VTPPVCLIATELTLPRLLWRAMRRRPTCVLESRSLLQGQPGLVGRLVERLRAAGRVTTLADHPDLPPYADAGDFLRLANPFAESEAWMEERFDFAGAEARYGRYALAYRHIVCNEAFRRYQRGALIAAAAARRGTVLGLDAFDLDYAHHRFGAVPDSAPTPAAADRIIGAALAGLGLLALTGWVLSRLRLRRPTPRPLLLASDFLGGERDLLLWNELSDDPAQILVVFRDAETRRQHGALVAGWPGCMPTDGRFGLGDGLAMLAEGIVDTLRLYRAGRALPADLLRPLLVLPWKRAVYRALFNRYHPRFYWGRDDYNADHIIRSQELRRVGSTSVGIMHGLPSLIPVAHQIRYIDFDLYYTHGTGLYQDYYRPKWPAAMQVRAIGSVGLDRDELARLASPCAGDIVFIFGPSFHQDALFAAAREIAAALPERTLWINTKSAYRSRGRFGELFRELAEHGPANVREHRGRSYDLLFQARYWISESSTLVAEAAQFGRVGLCLDPDPRFKFLHYRQFPTMMVTSGADTVRRILDIESGAAGYDPRDLAALIRMDGAVCWDLLRQDFGLPRQGTGPLPHLAFLPPAAGEPV